MSGIPPSTGPAPRLAVILLHWKNEAEIWARVHELLEWPQSPDIWVVENQPLSNPSLPDPRLRRVRPETNLGYAGGINAARRVMVGHAYDYLVLMNLDVEVSAHHLNTLANVLQDGTADIVGPLLQEGPRSYAGGRDPVRWVHTRIPCPPNAGSAVREVDYVPGTLCLIRAEVFDAVGGLDERFFFSGEVADLCLRAHAAGYRCAVHTGVSVTHRVEDRKQQRETLYLYYSLRNRFLLVKKHRPHSATSWKLIWISRGLGMMLLRLLRGNATAVRAIACALCDGWRGQFGPTRHVFPS